MNNTIPQNVAVTLSGGIDSTTVLARIKKFSPASEVLGIAFKYDSKHNKLERASAQLIADYYGINLITVDLRSVFRGYKSSMLNSSLDIPEGHYEAENMKSTVVPVRNLIFATVAASKAIDYWPEASNIMLGMGMHAGDHAIYPDCRPDTINGLGHTLMRGSGEVVGLYAPYMYMDKKVIIGQGLGFEAPYHLTRTCYTASHIACGKCGSCVERLEAFASHNVVDPITYKKDLT